eukprot:3967955-Amphidinium_carterae.1
MMVLHPLRMMAAHWNRFAALAEAAMAVVAPQHEVVVAPVYHALAARWTFLWSLDTLMMSPDSLNTGKKKTQKSADAWVPPPQE